MCVLISCEVGGNAVPAQFVSSPPDLPCLPATLSCDASARYIAQRMSDRLRAPLIVNEHSLELVDVTRSPHHRQLFSHRTRNWSGDAKRTLIDEIYEPYRARIRKTVSSMLLRFPYVMHLSVRTFELRSKGKIRRADVGLLYDPANRDEVDLCLDWIDEMYDTSPMLRVRRNYPRRGTADSITKAMRGEFAGRNYLGIEVLLNRAWARRAVPLRNDAIDGICSSLRAITQSLESDAA